MGDAFFNLKPSNIQAIPSFLAGIAVGTVAKLKSLCNNRFNLFLLSEDGREEFLSQPEHHFDCRYDKR